jgi:hypothetical protein
VTSAGYNFAVGRWTLSDKIAGAASVVVLIALFLPWFSGSISSNNSLGLAAQTGSEPGSDAHGRAHADRPVVYALVLNSV